MGAQGHGPSTGGLQTLVTALPGEGAQAETGAITHFRMRLVGQWVVDQGLGVRAHPLCPVEQTPRTPFPVCPVRFGHVLGQRRMRSAPIAAGVASDASPAVQDFDGGLGDAGFDRLTDQDMRHAVVVAVDLEPPRVSWRPGGVSQTVAVCSVS